MGTLAMVAYDPTASQAAKRARPSSSADAAAVALVPYDAAADIEPIDAVPLNAVAPPRPRARPPRLPAPPLVIPEEEPACLRRDILPRLGVWENLEVHFIHTKRVTDTDLDPHQNRFRIPTDGAVTRLRPILNEAELDAANLLYDPASQLPELESEPEEEGVKEQGKKKRKRRGKVHGGLHVKLLDLAAGVSEKLLLSRWNSSAGTIVKGGWYMNYIRRCSFKENDLVDIWAFKQSAFRLMGTPVVHESPLFLLILKRDE